MGSCQLLATPNGTWTAGAMSLAPSRCRSWSSKNRCGRSAWIIMVLSWPSMKATSSTLTPMDFSVLMTLASAGMPPAGDDAYPEPWGVFTVRSPALRFLCLLYRRQ